DVERARSLPGVVAVVTGEDLRDFPAFSTGLPRPEVNANERRVLPLDRVRFVGEAVVAIAATSRYVAEDAGALVEIEWDQLPVIAPDVGGGFGQKIHLFPEDAVVPYLARTTGRPVKWIEDRYESLAASTHAKEIVIELEAATTGDGKLLALRGRYIGDAGA